MKKILSIIAIGLLTFGLYRTLNNAQVRNQQKFEQKIASQVSETLKQYALKRELGAADTTKLIAGFNYTMSGSGISSSATSFTLTSLTIPQNGYKIQDSDLSSTFYVTIEPGNRTRQEVLSCTTVVQNAAGTATLSGCTRGLSPITPFTASSTLQFAHAGGTSVIFSDPPNVFNEFYALGNVSTSTNTLIFSSTTPPRYDFNPTFADFASTTLASAGYVASTSYSGTVDASETVKGIIELATALETGSSTSAGGTSARLVIPSSVATDTPQNCTTVGCVVVSQIGGKIRQTFLDLTEAFTWTGAHTFNSATTTMGFGLSISTGSTTINGVYNTWPNTQGASSTVLVNNGSGKMLWQDPLTISTNSWSLLASTSLGTAASSLSLTPIPARTDLYVVITHGTPSDATTTLRFNGDSSSAYGWRFTNDEDGFISVNSQAQIDLAPKNTNQKQFFLNIQNQVGLVKVLSFSGSQFSASANAPTDISGAAVWNNTGQITRIDVLASTGNLPAGTRITVYGSR